MKIIGAGYAGLLAASILRRHEPVIYEQKTQLPFNHSAVLRFRNENISQATGIPFKKVLVHKAIIDCEGRQIIQPTLQLSNMYAQKVSGRIMNRSILRLDPVERWIAPCDFITQLAKTVCIAYGKDGFYDFNEENSLEPILSTIPMPVLMKRLNWDIIPTFKSNKIWNITAEIIDPEIDVYQTLYFPDYDSDLYRASLTGNKIILEFIRNPEIESASLSDHIYTALEYFGLRSPVLENVVLTEQLYGKIVPVNDVLRKNFIYHCSEKMNIYSLGRYATWRQILLDDLIHDIQFIESFILQRDLYRMHHSSLRG